MRCPSHADRSAVKERMTLNTELGGLGADRYRVLILDNEVTVANFVASPPLPWTRLMRREGRYQAAEGYPVPLTEAQARFEMRNWDEVWLEGIGAALQELSDGAHYLLIGNNAGQGLPLAQSLSKALIVRAAIIYGQSLPEQREYEKLGYRMFFPRSESVSRLVTSTSLPIALFFINTIQHNEFNYHDP
jgi:hypothetical protein